MRFLILALAAACLLALPGAAQAQPRSDLAEREQSCFAGKGADCRVVARVYALAEGVPRDRARAARLQARACEGGDLNACAASADQWQQLGAYAQALPLAQRSCDGGDAFGCTVLALHYENGLAVAADRVRATRMYEKACEQNMARACFHLAGLVSAGKEPARYLALLERACTLGDGGGCGILGSRLREGRGSTPADPAKALSYFERGCFNRSSLSCIMGGRMYLLGEGAPRNERAGRALYERAIRYEPELAAEYREAMEKDAAAGAPGW